jgi:hypothetical protein
VPVTVGHNPPVPAFFFSFTPNPFPKKPKNLKRNTFFFFFSLLIHLQLIGRKKKKPLVLTLGSPPEKGGKKKTMVFTLGSPPEKGGKKKTP